MRESIFKKALPVWGSYEEHSEKLNRHLIFRETVASLNRCVLLIAAADFYRLSVNGEFVGFGPARTARGYARVDVYDLSLLNDLKDRNSEIVIEVAGYCCKSLSTVWQDSFLCAEILKNGEVEKYTGRDFECFENTFRVRYTERYSVQRHFGEIYDARNYTPFSANDRIKTVLTAKDVTFIPRRVPFASCIASDLDGYVLRGTFSESSDGRLTSGEFGTGKKENAYSFSLKNEKDYGEFSPDKIEDKPYRYVGRAEKSKTGGKGSFPITVSRGEWIMVDFGSIACGFIRFCADILEQTDLIIAFSELCKTECFSFRNINLQGVIEYKLPRGASVSEESFEPYSFRHVAIFVKSGSVSIKSVGCRTYERDMSTAIKRTFRSEALNDIYRAALRTFSHNAVDLFTDCPSRERAGWLCDSFFTGRAEYFLYGETPIEEAFLENYVLYKNDGSYPDGVLPMCYPSTPAEGNKFIPQWDMWYVLEVCEYLTERRPDLDREIFRPSVMGILSFLARYENSDGLLENLPSCNFVEWSTANSWTNDVNYPTNFLYSEMLFAVSRTFSCNKLSQKAQKVRKMAVDRSFNGRFFVDHAINKGTGVYENQKHVSEACQYYSILYGGVDINAPKYAELRSYVINDFENFDAEGYTFCPKNAFIGLYLRFNVLINMNDRELLLKNLEGFCGDMSRTTGTLWEYKDGKGSLDHGFASYVALALPSADLPDALT